MLSASQIDEFREHGYLVCPSDLSQDAVGGLLSQLDAWIEDSRCHETNYELMMDGKARFDLEPGHTSEHPKLRRVANPADISPAYQQVLWDSSITDMVAELVGPSIKFHHCKLNIKLPGMATVVRYHQDHPFDPHTNDDMLTMLLLLDDMSEANGCLKIVPGSHRERYTHYRDGKFVGEIDPALYPEFDRRAVPITGRVGDVCFMHTWAVHGSESNRSSAPRRLLICDYTAADAFPLTAPAVPSPHTGRLLRGTPTRTARLIATTIELDEPYAADSFFGIQGDKDAAHAR
ncbi:MAG: phytanoyl-CoA dioxygenase family protein [Gammaproteobacteria bacterium]|nr:phytanoyl-CoA dioxygenase family protein [Gammaproteobacteria bacterium]MDH3467131.1 phytanoyl-CoA dioxygenase family protein [Gammaproteobacteria bacterium]